MHWTDERIKLIRRNSLRNEVDGIWDELERVEDQETDSNTSNISHSECLMLQRVLSDKSKVPQVCKSHDMLQNTSATDTATVAHPAHLPDFLVRFTGGAPGAYHMDSAQKKELGGPVSMRECQTLAQYLKPSVGGTYLLPNACTSMLRSAEDDEKTAFEAGNADVYKRLKRRMTQAAREDYPPTYV